MAVEARSQQLGVAVDVGINGLVAQHAFAQGLVALLHRFSECGVLQQPLPKCGRGVIACPFEVPRLYIVGIGEVGVAVGQVVVPDRASDEFSARTVCVLLLLVEVGAALVAVGIEAQLCVDEIVYKRGHVNIAGIAALWVGKIV